MNPIDEVVQSLTKLATLWFPEEVQCEDSYVVLQGVVTIFLDQAYYILMTDESIPLEHRQVFERKDLHHVGDVLAEHIQVLEGGSGEHFRDMVKSHPQLSMEMMINYVMTAYSRGLAHNTGGVTPALWAKQLQLAIPVRTVFQLCMAILLSNAFWTHTFFILILTPFCGSGY